MPGGVAFACFEVGNVSIWEVFFTVLNRGNIYCSLKGAKGLLHRYQGKVPFGFILSFLFMLSPGEHFT